MIDAMVISWWQECHHSGRGASNLVSLCSVLPPSKHPPTLVCKLYSVMICRMSMDVFIWVSNCMLPIRSFAPRNPLWWSNFVEIEELPAGCDECSHAQFCGNIAGFEQ